MYHTSTSLCQSYVERFSSLKALTAALQEDKALVQELSCPGQCRALLSDNPALPSPLPSRLTRCVRSTTLVVWIVG